VRGESNQETGHEGHLGKEDGDKRAAGHQATVLLAGKGRRKNGSSTGYQVTRTLVSGVQAVGLREISRAKKKGKEEREDSDE